MILTAENTDLEEYFAGWEHFTVSLAEKNMHEDRLRFKWQKITCVRCGKEKMTTSKKQVFCSNRCATLSYYKK